MEATSSKADWDATLGNAAQGSSAGSARTRLLDSLRLPLDARGSRSLGCGDTGLIDDLDPATIHFDLTVVFRREILIWTCRAGLRTSLATAFRLRTTFSRGVGRPRTFGAGLSAAVIRDLGLASVAEEAAGITIAFLARMWVLVTATSAIAAAATTRIVDAIGLTLVTAVPAGRHRYLAAYQSFPR